MGGMLSAHPPDLRVLLRRKCPRLVVPINPCRKRHIGSRAPSIQLHSTTTSDPDLPKVPTPLEVALSGQDPYRRIRYEQPLALLGSATHALRLAKIRTAWPGAYGIEPFLIPFWIISLLCDQVKAGRYRKTNGADYNNSPERSQTDMSFTISAVGDDHWASGVYLPGNFRQAVWSHEQVRRLGGEAFIPSSSTEIYTDMRYEALDPFFPNHQMWDPYTAPRFTLPPPRLEWAEMEKLSALQGEVYSDWEEVLSLNKPMRIYAIPAYRLVYKVDLGREFAFVDAQSPEAALGFKVSWPRGESMPVDPLVHKNVLGYSQRKLSIDKGGPPVLATYRFRPPSNTNVLVSTIFNAMKRRGPMTAGMWEDERILPLIGEEGMVQARTLKSYADHCLLGSSARSEREPFFPIKRNESSLHRSNLFAPRKASTSTNTSSAPSASSASASAGAGGTAERARATTERYGASWADKRNAHYRQRAQHSAGKVRDWMTSKSNTQINFNLSYPDPLPDPAGYYFKLGIRQPSSDYLSSSLTKVAEMDTLIRRRYHELSFVHHPDYGGEGDAFIELDAAKDALETLANRLVYFKTGKAAK